eukprot:g12646.t1
MGCWESSHVPYVPLGKAEGQGGSHRRLPPTAHRLDYDVGWLDPTGPLSSGARAAHLASPELGVWGFSELRGL